MGTQKSLHVSIIVNTDSVESWTEEQWSTFLERRLTANLGLPVRVTSVRKSSGSAELPESSIQSDQTSMGASYSAKAESTTPSPKESMGVCNYPDTPCSPWCCPCK